MKRISMRLCFRPLAIKLRRDSMQKNSFHTAWSGPYTLCSDSSLSVCSKSRVCPVVEGRVRSLQTLSLIHIYVQNVTAEDLEEHKGEGYLPDSVIGRSGMEGLFEKELKGQNGRIISIVTSQGEEKQVLAAIPRIDGQDITLTIDSSLQELVYDTFRDSKSCTVAMNPYTGEVLALVNTPSYDNNDFIQMCIRDSCSFHRESSLTE